MEYPLPIRNILSVIDNALIWINQPPVAQNESFTSVWDHEKKELTLSFFKEGFIPFDFIINETNLTFLIDGVIHPAFFDIQREKKDWFDLEDDLISLFIYKTVVTRSVEENKVSFYDEQEEYLGAFIQSVPVQKDDIEEKTEVTYLPLCSFTPAEREEMLYKKEKKIASVVCDEREKKSVREKKRLPFPYGFKTLNVSTLLPLLVLGLVVLLAYAFNASYLYLLFLGILLVSIPQQWLAWRRRKFKMYSITYNDSGFEKALRKIRDLRDGLLLCYDQEYVVIYLTAKKGGEILYLYREPGKLWMTTQTIGNSTLKAWKERNHAAHQFLELLEG